MSDEAHDADAVLRALARSELEERRRAWVIGELAKNGVTDALAGTSIEHLVELLNAALKRYYAKHNVLGSRFIGIPNGVIYEVDLHQRIIRSSP